MILAPLLMTGATLATRRWGAAVGGWIIGLPITSGPISFFLTLEQGRRFAALAAGGSLLGINAVVATVLTYALLARRWSWPITAAASAAAFFVATAALHAVHVAPWTAFAVTCLVLTATLVVVRDPATPPRAAPAPSWDLPARSVAALAMMLGITWLAGHVGAEWSGLLSPFPVFTMIMAIFGHRSGHPGQAVSYARGLTASLYGFAAFFLVIALAVERLGPGGVRRRAAAAIAGGAAGVLMAAPSARAARRRHG